MNASDDQDTVKLLRVFPVFYPLPDRWLNIPTIIRIHILIVGLLYAGFFLAAFLDGQLWIPGGIGALENPPFFVHLLATTSAIPFFLLLAWRLIRTMGRAPEATQNEFWATLQSSRLVRLVSAIGGLLGLIALAGSLVMASTFKVDIYDSISNFPTFVVYSIIRAYQYLVCYPTIIVAALVLPWITFLSLRRSAIGYMAFAIDGIGGLKRYLKIFDTPMFVVQTLAVALALANYIGWGGFSTVSSLIAVSVPLIVTALAAALYLSFAMLIRTQREIELQKIVEKQNSLYRAMLNQPNDGLDQSKDIAEELEASVRVYELVRSTRNYGWIKYLANLSIAIAPQILSAKIFSQLLLQVVP